MKNILFVCTGNSARSIIAESIINNEYSNKFKAFSAGSNPSGTINIDVRSFLEKNKNYDLTNCSSKNFEEFINNEINILQSDYPSIESVSSNIVDTLQLARAMHPGQRNSLDALVDRYQIHGYDRNYHGALLDSKILADVYLSMTGGQTSIGFSQEISQSGNTISESKEKKVFMVSVSKEESKQHLNYLKSIRE